MTVSENKFVSLVYELKENDINGKHIETVTEDKALSFVYGIGHMLPKFEENIKGLKANDTFEFGLTAEDAYGPIHDDARAEVPKEVFMYEGKVDDKVVFVDNVLPMQDKDGNVFYGKITGINETTVNMDFNHPLAGVNLHFKGKLIEVREATDEDMNPAHEHGNSCGDDCGDDCGDTSGHSCGCGC